MNNWTSTWIQLRSFSRHALRSSAQRCDPPTCGVSKRYLSNHKPSLPPKSSASTAPAAAKVQRLDRFLARTPRFLQKHVSALRSAPVTHITAFLLLHELTAVIPLFGLAGAFHYYHWLPPYFAEGEWVLKGVELFGRYFRRKGWIAADEEQAVEQDAKQGKDLTHVERTPGIKEQAGKWFGRGEGGTRLVVEFATAYAIVKLFMPLRLVVSAWGAPWFARWTVVPLGNAIKGFIKRRKKVPNV